MYLFYVQPRWQNMIIKRRTCIPARNNFTNMMPPSTPQTLTQTYSAELCQIIRQYWSVSGNEFVWEEFDEAAIKIIAGIWIPTVFLYQLLAMYGCYSHKHIHTSWTQMSLTFVRSRDKWWAPNISVVAVNLIGK